MGLEFSVVDLVDILVVAALLYWLLRALRRGKGGFALIGILIAAGVFLAARTLGLRLFAAVSQDFLTFAIVALIVIYQDELRRFFEQLAAWSLQRREQRAGARRPEDADVLVRTAQALARQHVGALVVLEGRVPLAPHVDGGTALDGALSEPLLQSIFDPHSTGHDGAVIVAGGRVTRFGAHLPLSTDTEQTAGRGTRHAAALGLAERTDALCLVVSEERGTISVASAGTLEQVDDVGRLAERLHAHLRRPRRPRRPWFDVVRTNLGAKAAAVGVAAVLWFFLVHESVLAYRTYTVPLAVAGVPRGLVLDRVEPAQVRVIVSAPRRTFYFLERSHFAATLPLFDLEAGEQERQITAAELTLPDGVTLVNIVPRALKVVARAP